MPNRFDRYRGTPTGLQFGTPDPGSMLEDRFRGAQFVEQGPDAFAPATLPPDMLANAGAMTPAEQQRIVNELAIAEGLRRQSEADAARKGEANHARRMIDLAQGLYKSAHEDWFSTGSGSWPARLIPHTPAYQVAQGVQTLQGDAILDRFTDLPMPALDQGGSKEQFQSDLDARIMAYQRLLPPDEQPTADRTPPMLPRGAQGGERVDHGRKGYYDQSDLADGVRINGGTGYRIQDNPALRGVNARISKMIGEGKNVGQIQDYIRGLGIDPAEITGIQTNIEWRKKNPTYRGGYTVNIDDEAVPLSTGQQFLNLGGQSGPGAYVINAADAVTLGNMDSMTANPELTRALMGQVSDEHPYWALGGQVSGAILDTLLINRALAAAPKLVQSLRGAKEITQPTLTAAEAAQAARIAAAQRGIAADTIYGAGYGFGNSDGTIGDRVKGAVVGGAFGHIASRGGDKLMRGVGHSLTGVTDPAIRYLHSRGIRMTPGQMAGGRLKVREDQLAGNSSVGHEINVLRDLGIDDFNRVAFDDGMAGVGGYKGEIGEVGIGRLLDDDGVAIQGYRNALDGFSAEADDPFIKEYGAAVSRGRKVPGLGDEVRYAMVDEPQEIVEGATISGDALQKLDRLLQDRSASLRKRYNVEKGLEDKAFTAIDQGGEALKGLVVRHAPDRLDQYIGARNAFANAQILDDAVKAARNRGGRFLPSELNDAVLANARSHAGRADVAAEDRAYSELLRAAQEVLPSKMPDSAVAGPAGGGNWASRAAGMAKDAAMGQLYSPALQPVIQALMLARAPKVVKAGEKVLNNRRYISALGAPLLLDYVHQQ